MMTRPLAVSAGRCLRAVQHNGSVRRTNARPAAWMRSHAKSGAREKIARLTRSLAHLPPGFRSLQKHAGEVKSRLNAALFLPR